MIPIDATPAAVELLTMPHVSGMPAELERRLFEIFDALNAAHFGGRLPPPNFMSNGLGGHFGFYIPKVRIISLHPRTLQQDEKFITDTMLHELVHYALELDTGDHAQDHGMKFVERANEIGASLGLRALRADEPAVLEWPQSLRPKDYAPWR